MSGISAHYFAVQKLTFAGLGISLTNSDSPSSERLIKRPWLLYGITLSSLFHCVLVIHYAYIHVTDFVEITDSVSLLCQLVLCFSKISIFISKRQAITMLIKEIHRINYEAKNEEMVIVQRENAKDHFLCTLFLRLVIITGGWAVLHPAIYGLYVYFYTGEIVLTECFRASYFWDYSNIFGYSLLYIINICTAYFGCIVSLAFDTLFYWFVSNIVAQFYIIRHRFEQLGVQQHSKVLFGSYEEKLYDNIIWCIQYQRQALHLAEKLNTAYEHIICIKFIVVCSQISSVIFQVSRPNDSLAELAYKFCVLCAVALQLMLYCWNGQRIKDEVFKTAGSLLAALKTMDENQA